MWPKKLRFISKNINYKTITLFGVIALMSWHLNLVSPIQHISSTSKPETEYVGLVLTTQHIRSTNRYIRGEVHHDEISIVEKQQRLTTLCAMDKVADAADSNVTSDIRVTYEYNMLPQLRRIHDDNVRKQGHFERANLTKRLPTCLIIGVSKAGTEELRDFMGVHPYVVVKGEEANYFNTEYAVKAGPGNYEKGPIWYKNGMPESYASQITIEKTPEYFCSPEAPKRVHDMNKDMKLILILREPSSRVFSHFTWRHQKPRHRFSWPQQQPRYGYTNFEEYIFKNELINSQNKYVNESIYVSCMRMWLQHFDLSQFLIIESNEFRVNPLCVLQKTENFLGLEHIFNNETFVFIKQKGFYCVKETIQTGTKYTNAYCYNEQRGRNEHFKQVNATIIRALESFFKPYNEDLFQLIGQRFDW